jgi:Ca2+-binding RTX toxin-like protein
MPNILRGTTKNDVLQGTNGDDHFIGDLGDDIFILEGGQDIVWGGQGTDIARLSGSSVDYDIYYNGDAWWFVYSKINSTDYYQLNTEKIEFSDKQENLNQPTYTVVADRANVSEGQEVTYSVSTNTFPSFNGYLRYQSYSLKFNVRGVTSDDIASVSSGNFNGVIFDSKTMSGNVFISTREGTGNIKVKLAADSQLENETLIIDFIIQTDVVNSVSNRILDASSNVPTYALVASSASVNEGSTATFILSTTNVLAGTQVGYTLSGVSAADVQGGNLSGNATVGSNGQATISVELLTDKLTEGVETLTVTAGDKTASTTINDTSLTPPKVLSVIDSNLLKEKYFEPSTEIELKFSEDIKLGNLPIKIRIQSADGSTIDSYFPNVTDCVTIDGSILKIKPRFTLAAGVEYFLDIPQGSVLPKNEGSLVTTISLEFETPRIEGERDHIYHLINVPLSFIDAKNYADSLKESLAVIETSSENYTVFSFVSSVFSRSWLTAPDAGSVRYVWLGASDIAKEGSWVWVDGRTLDGSYTNWAKPREPDGGTIQNALGMALQKYPSDNSNEVRGRDGFVIGAPSQWNDISQVNKLPSVAQVNSHVFVGTKIEDLVLGSSLDDNISGGDGDDVINAANGNDTIQGGGGNDTIDGGAGFDTAMYIGSRAQYTVQKISSGYQIVDNFPNRDGNDPFVRNIEKIIFIDGSLVFDVASTNAPAAYRLYGGAFARTPDETGFRFWASTLDKNVSLRDVATQFISSGEFIGRYGASLGNAAFVDALYQNVLSRGGDAGGVAYWNKMLNDKLQDRSDVLVQFTQLPEFVGISAANITNGYWAV